MAAKGDCTGRFVLLSLADLSLPRKLLVGLGDDMFAC